MAELKTAFWRKAAKSLRPADRERYLGYLESAERWDLVLDALIDAWSRLTSHPHPHSGTPA